jgi:hypothetical protein
MLDMGKKTALSQCECDFGETEDFQIIYHIRHKINALDRYRQIVDVIGPIGEGPATIAHVNLSLYFQRRYFEANGKTAFRAVHSAPTHGVIYREKCTPAEPVLLDVSRSKRLLNRCRNSPHPHT